MPSPFIADGYTRCDLIAERDLFPPVRVEYRPMIALDQAQLIDRIRQLAPDGVTGMSTVEWIVVQELSRRLVSWTLVGADHVPRPISDETLMHADPHFLAKLTSIVLGLSVDRARDEALDEKNCSAGCGFFSPHPAWQPATVAIAKGISTTKRPVVGHCMRANRSCGQPAHFLRAGCRTWVASKVPLKIHTLSRPGTCRRIGSIASAGRLDITPMTPSFADTHS